MKKLIYTLLLLLLLLIFATANVFAASNGTTALSFLEMGAGARYVGMGGAGTAIANDANTVYWNPGLIAKAKVNAVDLMHAIYAEDASYSYVGLIMKINDKNAFGVSGQFFTSGEMETFDDTGMETGTITPYDGAVSLAYALNIKGFGIGAGAKFIQSQIINTANCYALSFGISFPDLFEERVLTGFSVTNIGVGEGLKYGKEIEKLPMGMRFGAGVFLLENLLITADAGKVEDRDIYVAAGIEYTLEIGKDMNMALRGGYNTISESGEMSGASAGFGIESKSAALDYAFVPMGNLGDTHRISITFFW